MSTSEDLVPRFLETRRRVVEVGAYHLRSGRWGAARRGRAFAAARTVAQAATSFKRD